MSNLIKEYNNKIREGDIKRALREICLEYKKAGKIINQKEILAVYVNKIDEIIENGYIELKKLFEKGSKYEIK